MISVIICSVDNDKYRSITNHYSQLLQNEDFEIIGIHDAKSLCEGYNRGIQQSRGDILVFSHDDIEILSPNLAATVTHHLSTFDIVGVAGTTLLIDGEWVLAGQPFIHGQVAHYFANQNKYAVWIFDNSRRVVPDIQALDGLFFAVRRSVFERIRFDENLFDGFHHYDLDFTFTAYLSGYKLSVCNDIHVLHQSVGQHDEAWHRYRERFRRKFSGALARNQQVNRLFKTFVADNKDQVMDFFARHTPPQ